MSQSNELQGLELDPIAPGACRPGQELGACTEAVLHWEVQIHLLQKLTRGSCDPSPTLRPGKPFSFHWASIREPWQICRFFTDKAAHN